MIQRYGLLTVPTVCFFNQEGATTCACCKTDFPAYSGYDWCTEKLALVIATGLTKFGTANPENDARDMKAALKSMVLM